MELCKIHLLQRKKVDEIKGTEWQNCNVSVPISAICLIFPNVAHVPQSCVSHDQIRRNRIFYVLLLSVVQVVEFTGQ
jgi:hypothetical protein